MGTILNLNSLQPLAPGSALAGPSILNLVNRVIGYLSSPMLSGVRLVVDRYDEVLTSKVSTQMIVDFNYNRYLVSDNIAPMPRAWEIGGYIQSATIAYPLNTQAIPGTSSILGGVNSISLALLKNADSLSIPIPGLEPSVFFMPSLKEQYNILQYAWLNNKLVWFRDKYGVLIPVAIERLTFKSEPTIQNSIPFTMTLKEIITYMNGVQQATAANSSYFNGVQGTPQSVSTATTGSVIQRAII